MYSAAEGEVRTVHNNDKTTILVRVALDKMVHTQCPTPIKIDNNKAKGFVNNTIRKKISKAFDMRFH